MVILLGAIHDAVKAAGVLANLVCLTKLNRYSKGIVTVLWKKENGGAVSLLIIFYAT